jgi:hypothetical protein
VSEHDLEITILVSPSEKGLQSISVTRPAIAPDRSHLGHHLPVFSPLHPFFFNGIVTTFGPITRSLITTTTTRRIPTPVRLLFLQRHVHLVSVLLPSISSLLCLLDRPGVTPPRKCLLPCTPPPPGAYNHPQDGPGTPTCSHSRIPLGRLCALTLGGQNLTPPCEA